MGKMFGPIKNEVRGESKIRWTCSTCSIHGRGEKFIINFGRRSLRKVTLGGPGTRWEDNSKMEFKGSRVEICEIDSTDSGWGQR
jgi:hypothetical protein